MPNLKNDVKNESAPMSDKEAPKRLQGSRFGGALLLFGVVVFLTWYFLQYFDTGVSRVHAIRWGVAIIALFLLLECFFKHANLLGTSSLRRHIGLCFD